MAINTRFNVIIINIDIQQPIDNPKTNKQQAITSRFARQKQNPINEFVCF